MSSDNNAVYDIEKENLETHVTLCAERYKRLEDKFLVLELRLERLCEDVKEAQDKNEKSLSELKHIIERGNDNRFKAIAAAGATVIAALISAIGYLILNVHK